MRHTAATMTSLAVTALLLAGCRADSGAATSAPPPAPPANRFVAPNGNDAWSGRLDAPNADKTDGPFATLERARDELRSLRKAGTLPTTGATVELRGGVYELPRPFALTAEDGGTAAAPVLYRPRQGEEVRLIGGKVLNGWLPVADPAILDRLVPEARGKVLQCALKDQGVTDLGAMKPGKEWGKSEVSLELFFQDRPMTLARYPNEGYLKITRLLGPTPMDIYGTKACREGIFGFEDDRAKRWGADKDIMVHGCFAYDWADQRLKVASIDAEQKVVTIAPPQHSCGYRGNQWFYFYNLLSEIDTPGEWYLDRTTGVLYFWPPAPLESGLAVVSVLPSIVTLQDVAHLTLRGLTLECCRAVAVPMNGGTNTRLAGCVVRNTGSYAATLEGGSGNGLVGCDLRDTGDGGVILNAGDRKTLTSSGHYVENCHIQRYGRWNPMYKPAVFLKGVGGRVAHCLIHDGPHSAILYEGNEHIIEYNEFHSVVYDANDAGVIYAYHDWTFRGQKIRYNFIHHIYGHDGRGCNGVFQDNVISGSTIVGNLFYEVRTKPSGAGAIFLSGGRDNLVENNLFVNCDTSVYITSCLAWPASQAELTRKLKEFPYTEEPWRSKYPQLLTIQEDDPGLAKGNVIRRNVCWGEAWLSLVNRAQLGTTVENNLALHESPFVNEATGDFRLREDSPAWKLGFEKIPLEKIGPYADDLRASWPVKSELRPIPPRPQPPPPKPHPNHALARKTATPITLDGVVAPDEWPAPNLLLTETPVRQPIKGAPAKGRVCHDGTTLYVTVTVPVTDAAKVKLEQRWGQGDGAEVVLRDASGPKPGLTFAIQGYANGKHESMVDGGCPDVGKKLGDETKFAAKVGDKDWTGEWAIPLAAAGVTYKPGAKLGFNVGVFRTESGEWIIWAGALGSTINLDNGGTITLE